MICDKIFWNNWQILQEPLIWRCYINPKQLAAQMSRALDRPRALVELTGMASFIQGCRLLPVQKDCGPIPNLKQLNFKLGVYNT